MLMVSEPSGIEEQQTTSLYREGHDLMSCSYRQQMDMTMASLSYQPNMNATFASFTYVESDVVALHVVKDTQDLRTDHLKEPSPTKSYRTF